VNLIDHVHGCDDLVHVHSRRLDGNGLVTGTDGVLDSHSQLAPARKDAGADAQSGTKSSDYLYNRPRALTVREQEIDAGQYQIKGSCRLPSFTRADVGMILLMACLSKVLIPLLQKFERNLDNRRYQEERRKPGRV
jgi:hypothetical protein